jgi:hypothetical protein
MRQLSTVSPRNLSLVEGEAGEQFYTDTALSMSAPFIANHQWRFHMLNPWFAITFQAARFGFEAQHAAALQLIRLVGGTSKTEVADKIAAPPDVPADAAPPVVQVVATKLASDEGGRRESVNKVHKKRSRAKTTAGALSKRHSLKKSAPRKA